MWTDYVDSRAGDDTERRELADLDHRIRRIVREELRAALGANTGSWPDELQTLRSLTKEMQELLAHIASSLDFIQATAENHTTYLEENFRKAFADQQERVASISAFSEGIVPVVLRAITEIRGGCERDTRELVEKMTELSAGESVSGDLTLRCALLAIGIGVGLGLGPAGYGAAGGCFAASVVSGCWG